MSKKIWKQRETDKSGKFLKIYLSDSRLQNI